MSHHLYTTDAIILGSANIGEAHRSIDLLTRELGRLRAFARSVREEKSKLRFSLQDLTLAKVSLVRGRDIWRIVGAEERRNIFCVFEARPAEQQMVIRLASLLRRLLRGEEENQELFALLSGTLAFLEERTVSDEELKNLECLTVLRILYNLGYLAKDGGSNSLLDTFVVTPELVAHVSPLRFELTQKINMSLQESQL